MSKEIIELFRGFVPNNKVIGTNSGQHYMTIKNKLRWLANLAENTLDGSIKIGGFDGKDPFEKLKELNKNGNMKILDFRIEIWKCDNRIFDLLNYTHTYKSIIDVYTGYECFEDDNWNIFKNLRISGGGKRNWDDKDTLKFRYRNDGLPNSSQEMYDYWLKENGDVSSFLIRIIVEVEY